MARPRVHTAVVGSALLEDAVALVARSGVTALSLRELAAGVGTSTTAVYSLFGNKEGLQRAVLVRAFELFAAEQEQVPVTEDPVADVMGLGAVYVQWAVDNPNLYEVMYGKALIGVAAAEATERAASRAMAPLTSAVERAIDAGAFRPADIVTVSTSLWAQVHGLASLILTGDLPEGVDTALAASATVEGWRRHETDPAGA